MRTPHDIWPLLCPSFVHLLVCSPQEEEDLQSEVTVRRWSSLYTVLPYSHQPYGFDGAEVREGWSGWVGTGSWSAVPTSPFFPFPSFPSSSSSSFYPIPFLPVCFPLFLLTSYSSFSSQFSSCFLTTSTIPRSFHLKAEGFFYSACLWCSFAPRIACWPAICYSL